MPNGKMFLIVIVQQQMYLQKCGLFDTKNNCSRDGQVI